MEEKMKPTTLCGWVLLGCSQGVVSLRSYAGVNKPADRPVLQRLARAIVVLHTHSALGSGCHSSISSVDFECVTHYALRSVVLWIYCTLLKASRGATLSD